MALTDDPNALATAQAPKPKPAPGVDPTAAPAPTAAPLSLTGASAAPPVAPKTDVAPGMAPAQTAVASATQNTADPLAFSAMSNTATNTAAPTLPGGGASTQPVTPPTPPADPLGGGSTQPAGPPPQPASAPDLTAGYTFGDPLGDNWGNAYYNGQKVTGKMAAPDGKYYWGLADGSMGPEWSQASSDALLAKENANFAQRPPPAAAPAQPDAPPQSPTPPSTTGPNVGVGTHPTDPLNALTQQTITPNNTVDRVKLARDAYNSAVTNDLNPQFQADLRDTNRLSFGAGRGVSGQNRTRLGTVTSDYERTKANLENQLITGATTGSIDDMYKNLGIAQQQQGFEAGQQQTAFNQNYSLQQLSDSERSQLFNEAMQQFYAGNISDPAQFYELLASQYARPVGAAA